MKKSSVTEFQLLKTNFGCFYRADRLADSEAHRKATGEAEGEPNGEAAGKF